MGPVSLDSTICTRKNYVAVNQQNAQVWWCVNLELSRTRGIEVHCQHVPARGGKTMAAAEPCIDCALTLPRFQVLNPQLYWVDCIVLPPPIIH